MNSLPIACPFCRSERLVTGKLVGGMDNSNTVIVLAGVSINFWQQEIGRHINAVIVEKQAVLCLGCGMAWAKAVERSALKLIEKFGSEELKRLAAGGGTTDTQPMPDGHEK